MKRIAYQGTKASFSEMAIERFFGSEVTCLGKMTFQEVFESLDNGEVELAAVPVENSLIGPIVENFDLFAKHDVSIVGELCLPIEHCLVGKPGQSIDGLKQVLSHPKALAQCTAFFHAHPGIESVVHFDTAGAAEEIAKQGSMTQAAIASRKTADVYGLEILQANLEDDPSNTTRFLFLRRGKPDISRKEGKCSLLFTLKHEPGALAQLLTVLAIHELNLTQIVSRPIRERPFEYLFFVDILFSEGVDLPQVLEEIREHTQTLKLLGLYEPSR